MTTAKNKKIKLPETEEGSILFNIDPIILKDHYEIDYIHSYAQDFPFFAGLSREGLAGNPMHAMRKQVRHAQGKLHDLREGNRVV